MITTLNAEQLAEIGRTALAWSRAYVAVKAALVKEGVPPDEAERVAEFRMATAEEWQEETGEKCPLCGRRGEC